MEIGKKIVHFWNNDKRTLKSHAAVAARQEPQSPDRKKSSNLTPSIVSTVAAVNPAARDAFP